VDRAVTRERRVRILRKENGERTGRHSDPHVRPDREKLDVFVIANEKESPQIQQIDADKEQPDKE
jgi:hypothetical protein